MRIAICQRTGFPLAILFWWSIAAFWGALNAWNYRYLVNPDGLCYLDMAREALQHGPRALVNPLWSPLYPALIALWNLLLRPEPIYEFIHVHALNAVIYFAAAVSFGFFLREVILFRARERGPLWKQGAFIAFSFVLFLRYTNAHILPFAVAPDILLSATIFAAAACFFRILREPGRRRFYVALGCALGLGYYAKSIMFPAAICLLGLLVVCHYRSGGHVRNVLIAAAVMLLLCAPQILAVSARVGHVSFGEAGRLNYLWWVQQIRQFQGWTGTPGGDTPVHGPRLILSDPEVLEFGTPIAGTYPLWYDPAYWYAGANVQFEPEKQWAAFKANLVFFEDYFWELFFPAVGLVTLGALSLFRRTRPGLAEWCFVLWPLAVLLMYLLLHIEFRYIAPWLILIFIGCYSGILVRNGIAERALLVLLAVTFISPRLVDLAAATRMLVKQRGLSGDMLVARELEAMGIKRGDAIATVGNGFQHYYAYLAGVHIVAQISNPKKFWSLTPSHVIVVEQTLAQTGAKALLTFNRPPGFQPNNWHSVPGTSYSILRLKE
jgi:hypothetical protein